MIKPYISLTICILANIENGAKQCNIMFFFFNKYIQITISFNLMYNIELLKKIDEKHTICSCCDEYHPKSLNVTSFRFIGEYFQNILLNVFVG